jgi:hypothetical protein
VESHAQLISPRSIEIEVLTDSGQVVVEDEKINLNLRCQNFCDQNLLLYGFDSDFNSFTTIDQICDVDHTSARFALFIYDENSEIRQPDWSLGDIDYKPMPAESLEAFMKTKKLQYLTETRVIAGNAVIIFRRNIDLKDYHLTKGNYYLQVGYYSGVGVEKALIGKTQIEKDKVTYNAQLYQGCSISNKIRFVVK